LKTDPLTGLILPDDVLDNKLKREVWMDSEELKFLRRAQKAMNDRHVSMILQCNTCKQAIVFQSNEYGETEGLCGCKRRVFER